MLRPYSECVLFGRFFFRDHLKTSSQVSQGVVVIKKTGDKSSMRWNFSIPHFRFKSEGSAESTPLNTLKGVRGNTMLTTQLEDNSPIMLNVKDEREGNYGECFRGVWIR